MPKLATRIKTIVKVAKTGSILKYISEENLSKKMLDRYSKM